VDAAEDIDASVNTYLGSAAAAPVVVPVVPVVAVVPVVPVVAAAAGGVAGASFKQPVTVTF